MYKKHLDLHDIRIGDWVQEYSEITGSFSMPMYVSAIFADGTIYLDFNGNEGDIWEANIEDIAPIKIDKNTLKGFGFKCDNDMCYYHLQTDKLKICLHSFRYNNGVLIAQFGEDIGFTPNCKSIHELQHAYYKYTHIPLVLSWKGI